jgi:DNA topoisomerase III
MDRTGIGTDATIAQHISTIQVHSYPLLSSLSLHFNNSSMFVCFIYVMISVQERSYAFKNEDQRFVPTKRGRLHYLLFCSSLPLPLPGIGLVEGYNNMGYQLNKPFLRASMEQDCQRIVR